MACRLAIALLLAANVHEPRRIHLQFYLRSKSPSPRLLQSHNYRGGLISYFNADRGGQAYAYKPELP